MLSIKESTLRMDNQAPTFNLKAVVRETGLKPDTLRAWERRYGLPEPDRTEGGHRLYSQEDIEILKWLIGRQDEGMSISRAVDLFRRMRAAGEKPLSPAPDASTASERGVMADAGQTDAVVVTRSRPMYADGAAISMSREAWIEACLIFDESAAEAVLAQAFALYPAEAVCVEVLMAGLSSLGAGWYQGDVTVQQEHFASGLAMRRLEALLAATPAPTRKERVMIACPPEEDHTFVPLMLALFLRRLGLDVIYLGADVPLINLADTLAAARPDLVVLTAQQLHTAATLMEMAQLLQQHGVAVAYGGLVFAQQPPLRHRIPGHYLGNRLDGASQVVDKLLRTPAPAPQIVSNPQLLPVLADFRQRRSAIEARLWQSMQGNGMRIPHAQFQTAVVNLSRSVDAVLTLGDVSLMSETIDWIQGLLVNHRASAATLAPFLSLYAQAVAAEMPATHEPISRWLAGVTKAT